MSLITVRTPSGFESTFFVSRGKTNNMLVGGEEALRLQGEADKAIGSAESCSTEQGVGSLVLGQHVELVATYGTLSEFDESHNIH